ncbi:kinase-like domain-containing protein [Armillaria borealis]|uniref:Kinase-like domain-containing protein n=1 Tax=Armillaria borealis TaxID=47425 RepID=A0AA39N3P1_9AGAR|nr:kinase-like domain-containing protein [Armillaria borealis]
MSSNKFSRQGFEVLYNALAVDGKAHPPTSMTAIEAAAQAYVLRLKDYALSESDPSILERFMLIIKTLNHGRSPGDLHGAITDMLLLLKNSPALAQDLSCYLPPGVDLYCCMGHDDQKVDLVVIRDLPPEKGAHIVGISSEIPPDIPHDSTTLRAALKDRANFRKLVPSLKDSSASAVLQLIQFEADDSTDSKSSWVRMCFETLRKFSDNSGRLPPSLYIRDVVRMGEYPVATGGFSDVYKGQTLSGGWTCLKILRMHISTQDEKLAIKSFHREVITWRMLRSPRMLEFRGIYIIRSDTTIRFGLVSPWMENGNIMEYLKEHPDHDRMAAIRQVVDGLLYLHQFNSFQTVHGDVKGANVFVKPDLTCCLGDFGSARVATTITWSQNSLTSSTMGSTRWMAPELLNPVAFPDVRGVQLPGDIYALGCTVLEVIQGQKPNRPEGISDTMWWVLQEMWGYRPEKRPDIQSVKAMLEPSFKAPITVVQEKTASSSAVKSRGFQWKFGMTQVELGRRESPWPDSPVMAKCKARALCRR